MSEHTALLRNLAKEAAQVNAEQTVQDGKESHES